MDSKLVLRLQALADDTLALILELQRSQKLGLDTTTQQDRIHSNTTELETELRGLDQVLKNNEDSGKFSSAELKKQEDTLLDLLSKLEKLQASSAQPKTAASEVLVHQQRKALLESNSAPPSLAIDVNHGYVDETVDNVQLVLLQQHTMEEQDRSIEELSRSVQRQHQLGVTIGDELDYHNQLLDETDQVADRTGSHLEFARKKLDDFRRKARKSRSCYLTLVLILLLMIVISLLKYL